MTSWSCHRHFSGPAVERALASYTATVTVSGPAASGNPVTPPACYTDSSCTRCRPNPPGARR